MQVYKYLSILIVFTFFVATLCAPLNEPIEEEDELTDDEEDVGGWAIDRQAPQDDEHHHHHLHHDENDDNSLALRGETDDEVEDDKIEYERAENEKIEDDKDEDNYYDDLSNPYAISASIVDAVPSHDEILAMIQPSINALIQSMLADIGPAIRNALESSLEKTKESLNKTEINLLRNGTSYNKLKKV